MFYGDCKECKSCNQINVGQQGEYPCKQCGLPTQWDNGLPSDLRKVVMEYVLDQGVYMLLSDRDVCTQLVSMLDSYVATSDCCTADESALASKKSIDVSLEHEQAKSGRQC